MASDRDATGRMSRRNVHRTRRAVQAVEASPLGGGASPPEGARPFTYGVVRARVTTAVPGGTWDSPSSSGRAQIRRKNPSGSWANFGDPVKVWNDNAMPSSLPVGRVVKLAWIAGDWWLVSASCS